MATMAVWAMRFVALCLVLLAAYPEKLEAASSPRASGSLQNAGGSVPLPPALGPTIQPAHEPPAPQDIVPDIFSKPSIPHHLAHHPLPTSVSPGEAYRAPPAMGTLTDKARLVMALLRPDLRELVMLQNPQYLAEDILTGLSDEVDLMDQQLQHSDLASQRSQGTRLRDAGQHAPRSSVNRAVKGNVSDPPQPFQRILCPQAANAAIAEFADRSQPANIVLMVDQVLQSYAKHGNCCSGDSVWVLGLIANVLGVLAVMQGPERLTYVYMQVIMRKAARHNVSVSALSLQLYRSELIAPLLATTPSLDLSLTSTPVWRVHLASLQSLNRWHGYDTILAFSDVSSARYSFSLWQQPAPDGSTPVCCTPLHRVSHFIGGVHEWWRDSRIQNFSLDRLDAHTLSSLNHRRRKHRQSPLPPVSASDVVPAVLMFKKVLVQQGCLALDVNALSVYTTLDKIANPTRGCEPLREFLRTESGRTAHVSSAGPAGSLSKWLAQVLLLLCTFRDLALLTSETTVIYLTKQAQKMLRTGGGLSFIIAPDLHFSNQTVLEWMSNTDPWTVLGTSVAAVLAVLRVVVRLSSAFSTAASLAVAPSAVPDDPNTHPTNAAKIPAHQPAAVPTNRRGKKPSKGERKRQNMRTKSVNRNAPAALSSKNQKVQQQPRAAQSSDASTLQPLHPLHPIIRIPAYNMGTLRVISEDDDARDDRRPSPLGSCASPRSTEALRIASTAIKPCNMNAELMASIRAVLPPMVQAAPFRQPTLDAPKGRMLGRHAAALAQLQLWHQITNKTGNSKAGDSLEHPFKLPRPTDYIANIDGEIKPVMDAPREDADVMELQPERDEACTDVGYCAVTSVDVDLGSKANESVQPSLVPCSVPKSKSLVESSAEAALSARVELFRKEECGSVPELFLCPISRELMESPVLASDGHIYEKTQIMSWLQRHATSPMTNMNMPPDVAPVLSLRSEIQDFKARFPHLL